METHTKGTTTIIIIKTSKVPHLVWVFHENTRTAMTMTTKHVKQGISADSSEQITMIKKMTQNEMSNPQMQSKL